ncbi:PepSY domain-containing protein [Sporosarcina sp. Sa2YVA2]|uniref:PepSY domain-containing protein n=1 Tax=Sporosarcina quadrami TaxID=2762234 RepID=A0ABR8U9A0_9BACL|nr:PepSY domain-containing protein [Sporosarcina quadrami]MBD7984375.1 PepSY domain-containing protein [Sporosarcina quadrami]
MKKLLLVFLIIIAMFFSYSYQSPIMITWEAIDSAEKHLKNPPKEWGETFSDLDWNDTPLKNVSLSLTPKSDFWSKLTNRMNWEVTIKNNGSEKTVVIDAYTGKLIDIYGPLN